MITSKLQEESNRLAALRGYKILDTPADGAFDHVTALAARFFKVPISLITLVDEDRIWFKSKYGLNVNQIPREPGLCASVIFSDEAYVVRDAIEDPRTLTNPLVRGEMGLRFYAAAPLVTHDGYRLGTMNVIDFAPRTFSQEDEKSLQEFAGIVMDQMELRLSKRKAIESLSSVLNWANKTDDLEQLITVCAWTKQARVDGEWYTFEQFLKRKLGLSITHGIHPKEHERIIKELSDERK